MKFYIDEDISPRVAEILRKRGIDSVSAHEVNMVGSSDEDQFAEAVSQRAAIVTRNRDDFITLTIQAFESLRPHYGLVVVSHSIPGSDFRLVAGMLEKLAKKNPGGMSAYTIEFLTKK